MDSVASHMINYPDDETFVLSDEREVDIVDLLKESGAEIALNYLPVGSEDATRYYVECCLEAGVAFINCIPVFMRQSLIERWQNYFLIEG